jgi:hypothetical protein
LAEISVVLSFLTTGSAASLRLGRPDIHDNAAKAGERNGPVTRNIQAVVAASGLVYLAAAALELPWVSWPGFFASVVVITLVRLDLVPVEATWALLAVAALFAAIGLARAVHRPIGDLPLQALAMTVFGATAAVALLVSPFIRALLVAAALFAHAGWDVFHHVKNKVMVRSMAEFCFVLDSVLGLAIVIVTLRGA